MAGLMMETRQSEGVWKLLLMDGLMYGIRMDFRCDLGGGGETF